MAESKKEEKREEEEKDEKKKKRKPGAKMSEQAKKLYPGHPVDSDGDNDGD